MRTYYEVLGVPRNAEEQQIRQAFRRLARQLHPDSGSQGSTERFREVTEAYRTLMDPERRRRYDETLPARSVAVGWQAGPVRSPQAPWNYRPPGPGCTAGVGHGGEIWFAPAPARAGFALWVWRAR